MCCWLSSAALFSSPPPRQKRASPWADILSKLIMFIYLCMCACEPVCFTVSVEVRAQLADVSSVLPQCSTCLSGIKLKFPSLAANSFTQWATSLASIFVILCSSTMNEWIYCLLGSPPPYSISITICVVSTRTQTASVSLHCFYHILWDPAACLPMPPPTF